MNKQAEFIEALRNLQQQMPLMLECVEQQAQMTKAKYDALIRAGFSKEEALELCKGKILQW
jgi:hypothetical protein